jgi:hypothetical protein
MSMETTKPTIEQAMKTDITPEKIHRMAELKALPNEPVWHALVTWVDYRKSYAQEFLRTKDENILPMIETCNLNIKQLLSL